VEELVLDFAGELLSEVVEFRGVMDVMVEHIAKDGGYFFAGFWVGVDVMVVIVVIHNSVPPY